MDLAVIIPCYNSALWVAETVASVLAQGVAPAEVIVVNDGSTDDSRRILESFGDAIRIIDQPNQGLSAARNAGAKASRSPWLAFLDADDLYEPDFVRAVQELHACFPEATVLFTDHSDFGPQGVSLASNMLAYLPDLAGRARKGQGDYFLLGPESLDIIISRNGAFSPSCLVVCRELFDRVGGFHPAFGSEDLDFYFQALPDQCVGVARMPLVRKRGHGQNMSFDYRRMRAGNEVAFQRADGLYRRSHPHLMPLVRKKRTGMLGWWAHHYYRQGDYEEARQTFLSAIRAAPFYAGNWKGWLASWFRSVVPGRAKS